MMTEDTPDCALGSDPETRRYSRSPNEELSTAIALSVADALDREIETLQPLADTLDVDALNSLFRSDKPYIRVEFEYADCLVTVRRGTEIRISLPD